MEKGASTHAGSIFSMFPIVEIVCVGDEGCSGGRCSGLCGTKARTLVRRRPARAVSSEARTASIIERDDEGRVEPREWPRVVTSCRSWQASPDEEAR